MGDIRFLSKYLALVVLIYGFYNYKNYSNSKAKYFIFCILFAVVTEFFGSVFYKLFNHVNFVVYNVFTIVQLTFFLWWYQLILNSKRRKNILRLCILIYLIFALANCFFGEHILEANQIYTFTLGVLFVLIAISFYFIESFNKETILNITDSIYFWFSLGVLLFYGTFMPFMISVKLFLTGGQKILGVVTFVLNIIMYVCFAIGFYKSKNKNNIDVF
ncbi:hypothetical protein [Kordia jejudonensis]|uniref:hypothetical protein n=1 Tax=Kordia jejudonensis TaxID=1348245 RepID=UPI0006291CBB|nr:hypothetical protein [Kordia jejudonensis]